MKFFIGCSGFQYDDWVGNFYPPNLEKRHFFSYYAKFFPTTEINSTFYSFPNEKTVNTWIVRSKGLVSFKFSFKLPQELTHSDYALTNKAIDKAIDFQNYVLEKFRKIDKLGAGLIQLSPFIDPEKDIEVFEKFQNLFGSLDTRRYRYAMEIRNSHFLKPIHLEKFLRILTDFNVSLVSVDSPGLPIFYYPTSDFSYVRFHGRNSDIWFKSENSYDDRLNRYDYLYTVDQLLPWADMIKKMNGDVFIYFNNHAYGKAAKNAIEFSRLLNVNFDTKNYNQKDLSSFETHAE